jgi:ATP-dependent RNA helicase DeaD
MQRYRIEVGRAHGVGPKNIVGAIANESGIDSSNIGRIEIHDLHSTIDLPEVLDSNFFRSLKGVRVGGQQLRLTKDEAKRFGKPGGKKDFGKRKFDKPAGAKSKNKAKNKFTVKANGKGPFKAKARKQRVK